MKKIDLYLGRGLITSLVHFLDFKKPSTYLLNSIDFAKSMLLEAYATIPIAARMHDLSFSSVANESPC